MVQHHRGGQHYLAVLPARMGAVANSIYYRKPASGEQMNLIESNMASHRRAAGKTQGAERKAMTAILSLAKPFGKSMGKVWVANEGAQKRPQEEAKDLRGSLAALLLGAFWHRRLDWQAAEESGPLNTCIDWFIGLDQGIRGG